MPKTFSLAELDSTLNQWAGQILSVSGELEEIQTRYVSAYQESKEKHDQALKALSVQAASQLEAIPAEVRSKIEARLVTERQTLEKRRQELRTERVPKAEQEADTLLRQAQGLTVRISQKNPELDKKEEALKAKRLKMEQQLAIFNKSIEQRSGCLRSLFNFSKLIELDRERHKLIGLMEQNAADLRMVREEWEKARREFQEEEEGLQEKWLFANLQAAELREELAQLDDDARRDQLALQRAVFFVLDEWKDTIPPGGAALIEEINAMAQHNIQTDDYQAGLGKVAGLIALLGGVAQGLQGFRSSVQSIEKEQSTHSAYLKAISVQVNERVLTFHEGWKGLRDKVRDEQALGQDPNQFGAIFDQEAAGWLSQKNITDMFDMLSAGLKSATAGWKG